MRAAGRRSERLIGWLSEEPARRGPSPLTLAMASCHDPSVDFPADAYEREILAFRAAREAKYRSEDGWLTLVDRIPLEPGASPTPLGNVSVESGGRIVLEVTPGMEVARFGAGAGAGAGQLVAGSVEARVPGPGDPGEPVVFTSGPRRYEIVRRGERLVMRVRDLKSPSRIAFRGIPTYSIDPAYRVVADFARLPEPEDTPLAMSDGDEDRAQLVGEAHFSLPGATSSASPLALQIFVEESTGRLYVPFGDRTNRDETYGGGRFLYGHERPGQDAAAPAAVVLDFNRACNPPCAFNPLVTCPLPPPANRLDVPIRAGERLPRGN